MSFDYRLLGKKLREARESLLIEPGRAANLLQISEDDYVLIESGESHLTGDQIVILAAFLRRDFRYFVTGDYPSAESQVQQLFRRNQDLSQADRIAIQEFCRLCEYQAFLEDLLDMKHGPIPDYSQRSFGHRYYKRQGEEAAILERNRLMLGRQPIPNVFALMSEQGVRVFRRRLQDRNISGLYLRHPVAGHCVLVNYLDDLYRQNFSAAHEYGHVLFDSHVEQQLSYLAQPNGEVDQELEWRANSFARNFLLPKERLEKDYDRAAIDKQGSGFVLEIARHFKVNFQVVVIQLSELGWIQDDLKTQLLADKNAVIKAQEKSDPEIPTELSVGTRQRLLHAIQHGLSWDFLKLGGEAYRRELITYHKLLEMLFLPIEDGQALLNEVKTFVEVHHD
jgi:Zn-dependent peptidase ImmA (M78 family)